MSIYHRPHPRIPGGRVPEAREIGPAFAAVIETYDRTADEEWQTRGHGRSYRQIRPDEWPGGVHYEFMNRQDEVGVELHLESDAVTSLAPSLAPLGGQELTPGLPLEWDPRWSRNRGRLVAKVAKDQNPDIAVRAMQALMSRTRPIVERYLKK